MPKQKLWALWPVIYMKALERIVTPEPRDAPRCQRCERVHYASWAIRTTDPNAVPAKYRPYLKWSAKDKCWYACRVIVADERAKMDELAKMMLDQHDIIFEVMEFDNRGVICPKMPTIPLRHYFAEMGLLDGGRKLFQVQL